MFPFNPFHFPRGRRTISRVDSPASSFKVEDKASSPLGSCVMHGTRDKASANVD